MKKIYATIALIGALATSVFAQRQVDVEVFYSDPVEITTICTDSFKVSYGFRNIGNDPIYAHDTFAFYSPRVDSGYISYIAGDTFLTNDTIYKFERYMKVSDIKRLVNEAGDAFVYPPFANGVYRFQVAFAQFGLGQGGDLDLEDTNGDNDGIYSNITISCPVGIKGLTKNNSTLKVFPNPAYNQVSFTNDFTAATTASVRITDIAGRIVKTMDLGKQNAGAMTYNIDVADLNNGMYYLELVTEDSRSISKFTKN